MQNKNINIIKLNIHIIAASSGMSWVRSIRIMVRVRVRVRIKVSA